MENKELWVVLYVLMAHFFYITRICICFFALFIMMSELLHLHFAWCYFLFGGGLLVIGLGLGFGH